MIRAAYLAWIKARPYFRTPRTFLSNTYGWYIHLRLKLNSISTQYKYNLASILTQRKIWLFVSKVSFSYSQTFLNYKWFFSDVKVIKSNTATQWPNQLVYLREWKSSTLGCSLEITQVKKEIQFFLFFQVKWCLRIYQVVKKKNFSLC